MKNAFIVFKKEFYRVMSDRRLIFTSVLLPGLAIYVMYSFMGNAISGEMTDVQEHELIVYTENMPDTIETMMFDDILQTDQDLKKPEETDQDCNIDS